MQLPNDTERLTVFGATGSGKTNAGLWHLSYRDYDIMPWIVYDYKCDETICSIEGAQELTLDQPLPRHPGVYIIHPLPDEEQAVSDHMMKVWAQQNTGVFVDEALMLGRFNKGFRSLLTQGRSLRIPMIICSQRPAWIDNFVFSESSYFQVFRLQSTKDTLKVQEFVPFNIRTRLPEYHSYYYDVKRNNLVVLQPTPDGDAILDTFYTRLRKLRKVV
jgi:hypothetical protein